MIYTIWAYNRPLKNGTPNGARIELTTEHAQSSYGIPVLVWYDGQGRIAHVLGAGDAPVLAYGELPIPGAVATHDPIGSDHNSALWYSGSDLVEAWLDQPDRTHEEMLAGTAFLALA